LVGLFIAKVRLNLKRAFHIVIVGLAIVGAFSIILFVRNLTEANRLDSAYLANCSKVEIGMTLEEARLKMRQGLDINHQGFEYGIQTKNALITSLSMLYSVDGGSYIIRIEIDKHTSLVKSINCPKKNKQQQSK
jgi:multisubunit Na+/H+ antiporter MnhE subunit